jgi:hypothetical protein
MKRPKVTRKLIHDPPPSNTPLLREQGPDLGYLRRKISRQREKRKIPNCIIQAQARFFNT